MKILFSALLVLTLSHTPTGAEDAPTGADLLRSCQATLADSASAVESMLCHWYATPCDCQHKDPIPNVCLPPTVEPLELARLLVDDLTSAPALLTASASVAANSVLADYYPCDD